MALGVSARRSWSATGGRRRAGFDGSEKMLAEEGMPEASGEMTKPAHHRMTWGFHVPGSSGSIVFSGVEMAGSFGEVFHSSGGFAVSAGEFAGCFGEAPRSSGGFAVSAGEFAGCSGEAPRSSGGFAVSGGEFAGCSGEAPRWSGGLVFSGGEFAGSFGEAPRSSGGFVFSAGEMAGSFGEAPWPAGGSRFSRRCRVNSCDGEAGRPGASATEACDPAFLPLPALDALFPL
jgi:hypothetical protein